MKAILLFLACLGAIAAAQETNRPAKSSGVLIERFTCAGARTYEGIWDPAKSQIHVVSKSNHVANVSIKPSEILVRKPVGDGSQVVLYSDLDLAERTVFQQQANYQAAQRRYAVAQQRRDTLHRTYAHKDLPSATYNAVMAQYKAADDEIANAQKAIDSAKAAFHKATQDYMKMGGKKSFSLTGGLGAPASSVR
jgi:hypothetical protein